MRSQSFAFLFNPLIYGHSIYQKLQSTGFKKNTFFPQQVVLKINKNIISVQYNVLTVQIILHIITKYSQKPTLKECMKHSSLTKSKKSHTSSRCSVQTFSEHTFQDYFKGNTIQLASDTVSVRPDICPVYVAMKTNNTEITVFKRKKGQIFFFI